ncbi:MAG: adenylyltransferase/cytidyltransferase family protein [Clostridiales Family XIII bacterium]|jgi:glycerol-3-phosphate cytidylyltransferase|nr:adenylyltransferase/cytidyltransferase family protein [Clostridiales Family XIII bacterium]
MMKRVITYGTFDLFHRGHRSILERAKALGDYLIVGVTGESYDRERGKLNVRDSLPQRIENVRRTGLADEIIVEEYLGQKLSDVIKYDVDALAIGADWQGKFDYLRKYCEVVYLERTKDVSSSRLREDRAGLQRIGIITDRDSDGELEAEVNFVSGLEICGIMEGEPSDAFMEACDIVSVHVGYARRYESAKRAIEAGRPVIIDYPPGGRAKLADLYDLAEKKGIVMAPRIPLAYLRTFHQLISMLRGGGIGNILSIECASPTGESFRDTAALAVFAATRILGDGALNIRRVSLPGAVSYDRILLEYEGAAAGIAVSGCEWLEPGMTVLGTDGRAEIPDAWWNMSYFRLNTGATNGIKRYSSNAEGPGLRYLLSDLLLLIEEGRTDSGSFTKEEALRLTEIMEQGGLL